MYDGQGSIAQPDYTAECLAAQRAGVEILLLAFESNSTHRIGVSCARQNYRPAYGSVVATLQDAMKEDPNLEGMFGSSNVFPWFQTGTSATDEYQRAMRDYGSGLAQGIGTAQGWTQGKLLEKATANLGEPPTNEGVLRGLWALTNETLGGLTPQPINFAANKPAQGRACWFNVHLKERRWTTPDGFQLHCK